MLKWLGFKCHQNCVFTIGHLNLNHLLINRINFWSFTNVVEKLSWGFVATLETMNQHFSRLFSSQNDVKGIEEPKHGDDEWVQEGESEWPFQRQNNQKKSKHWRSEDQHLCREQKFWVILRGIQLLGPPQKYLKEIIKRFSMTSFAVVSNLKNWIVFNYDGIELSQCKPFFFLFSFFFSFLSLFYPFLFCSFTGAYRYRRSQLYFTSTRRGIGISFQLAITPTLYSIIV